ncbi:MAG: peptidylprolyl isomerase, partial [Bacteroidota bacterium]
MGITAIRRLCQRMLVGVVVVLVVAMALGVFFVAIPKANGAEPDFNYHGPAVRVNGITLKDAEFQEIYNSVAQEASQYAVYGGMPGLEEMRETTLQRALNKLVIRSEIKKNKVRVPGADINRYFNRLAKQYFPTKDEKEQFYARNGFKNDRDFKNAIREYLEQIYLYRDLAKAKKIDVKISQAELREAYASVTLNHILLGTQTDAGGLKEEEAKKKADEVYAKVKAGEDWDKLAKQYSTDQSNKDKGGSLGEIRIKDLKASYDKDFTAAALQLKKGEFSAPVKSSFGYHIIQMVDRKEAEGPEFRNESRTIEAELIAQKFATDKDGEKYKQWLDARTKDADVVILDPALRA